MYEDHPCFKLTCPEDSRIWRYMDFTKLVSMLEESALWFTRADCFEDPFDSELPNTVIETMKARWEKTREEAAKMPSPLKEILTQQAEGGRKFWSEMRQQYVVNCWHQNEHESAAMWSLYLKSNEGIAIVSTPNKLIESVRNARYWLSVGSVEYVDFNNYPPYSNMFIPVLRKRMSFQHENELRVVALNVDSDETLSAKPFETKGVAVKIAVPQLIDAIYVSPASPGWLPELVEKITRRFKVTCEVKRSSLAEKPLW